MLADAAEHDAEQLSVNFRAAGDLVSPGGIDCEPVSAGPAALRIGYRRRLNLCPGKHICQSRIVDLRRSAYARICRMILLRGVRDHALPAPGRSDRRIVRKVGSSRQSEGWSPRAWPRRCATWRHQPPTVYMPRRWVAAAAGRLKVR